MTACERKVCWPESWVKAAVKAGFAEQTEHGSYRVFGGDEIRDKLQIFASEIEDSFYEQNGS